MGTSSLTQNPIKSRYMVMPTKDSELRELAENHLNSILNDAHYSKPANAKFMKDKVTANRDLMSLLDNCNDLNAISQKLNQPRKVYIGETAQGWLQRAIDKIMKRVERWMPEAWADLDKELQYEIKIAYDKFVNLMKKYSESIETSEEKHETDTLKAMIAAEIQDYVKCGIYISLKFFYLEFTSLKWVRKIEIHMEMLALELKGLNVRESTEMARLFAEVNLYKQCMIDFGDCFLSPAMELKSEAYSGLLQSGGLRFSDLTERKIDRMGLTGDFDSLDYEGQLQVCRAISKDFGGKITSEVRFVEFIFGDGSKTIAYPFHSIRVGRPVSITKRIIA